MHGADDLTNLDDPATFPCDPVKIQAIARLPKVFVVGCAKSGTSWVQHLLNAHPHVVIDGEGRFAWRLTPLLRQSIAQFNQHLMQFRKGAHTQISEDEQHELLRYLICMKLRTYVHRSSTSLKRHLHCRLQPPQAQSGNPCTIMKLSSLTDHGR